MERTDGFPSISAYGQGYFALCYSLSPRKHPTVSFHLGQKKISVAIWMMHMFTERDLILRTRLVAACSLLFLELKMAAGSGVSARLEKKRNPLTAPAGKGEKQKENREGARHVKGG